MACSNPCTTVISAGAYCPPCGYSTNEPAPPVPALPAFNKNCVLEAPVPRPWSRWVTYDDIVINKEKQENYATCKTFVIENNTHHQHNKTVITTVNRHHLHTQRIITKENNYHHFNTDYVVKVNDIHTQRVERLETEGATINDYRQTARVEAATCQTTVEGPSPAPIPALPAVPAGPVPDPCAVAIGAGCVTGGCASAAAVPAVGPAATPALIDVNGNPGCVSAQCAW